jgi:hypothetical protein
VPNKSPAPPKPKKEVVIKAVEARPDRQSEKPKAQVVELERSAETSPTEISEDLDKNVKTAQKRARSPTVELLDTPEDDLDGSPDLFDFDEGGMPDMNGHVAFEDTDIETFGQRTMPFMPHQTNADLPTMTTGSMPLSLSFSGLQSPLMDFDDPMNMDPAMLLGTGGSTPSITPHGLADAKFFADEDDIEEVVRTGFEDFDNITWSMAPVLPNMYTSSMSSISPGSVFSIQDLFSVPRGIDLSPNSPESLILQFDKQTCGILSVKDGPTENPWRTLIWPLAKESPALYHAIASMTSFHTSKYQPELRVQGIDHMRTSIKELADGIENMQFDTAIATTLALAFAESWDQHTSTGINHIRGANVLVNQALTWHGRKAFTGDKLERLKFLTNAWVYMDVLARLTCSDEDESNGFDAALSNPFADTNHFGDEAHIDPLMGAASTLFPIIGRVANLVRKVRRADRNSPTIISNAMKLKSMLLDWDPPMVDDTIEDPSVEIEHSIQTAEAYRWATLLYLHQAVPEIPSDTSAELGKKVMILLATVPLSSRTVIVQIYPLMAASCEAVDLEDRQWVHERWLSMAQRMKIGVIDRCVEVVNEVWDRRDTYEALPSKKPLAGLRRGNSGSLLEVDTTLGSDPTFPWSDPFANRKRRAGNGAFDMLRDSSINNRPRKASRTSNGNMDPEYTVRGRLHWLSVMKDWNWEGKSTTGF